MNKENDLSIEDIVENFISYSKSKNLTKYKIEDLNLQEGYITLRKVKNRKQGMIPLSQSIIEILKEYLQCREGEKDDLCFVQYMEVNYQKMD